MTVPVPESEDKNVVFSRELISIILLLLGSMCITIGSFIAFGLAIGLMVVGVLIFIVALVIGWQR